jgi:hypothetical protein
VASIKNRRGGILSFAINGVRQDAKGNFSYNLGKAKREAVVGADGTHGYKEVPQVPYIEGEITDRGDLDLAALLETTDATITLAVANGKTVVLRNGWFAGEGTVGTEEGNIAVRFEGLSATEA